VAVNDNSKVRGAPFTADDRGEIPGRSSLRFLGPGRGIRSFYPGSRLSLQREPRRVPVALFGIFESTLDPLPPPPPRRGVKFIVNRPSFLLFQGGFARVYLMTDVGNGSQYACKIIPKNRMQKIHMQKVRFSRKRMQTED